MWQNVLKSAWRQIWKNKAYSSISLLGLALGFSVAILSLLWVNYQLDYDAFHARPDRIYQAMQNYAPSLGASQTDPSLPMPMGNALRTETPGVKYVAVTDWGFDGTLVNKEVRIRKYGNYVEPDFLNIFTFPLLSGNKETALTQPNQIVISESTALALFGRTDVLGEAVSYGTLAHLQISGVLQDVPDQSTLQFDFLLPFSLKMQLEPWMADEAENWLSYSYQVFFELEADADIQNVLAQHQKTLGLYHEGSASTFNVHALPDWHLYNEFENGVVVAGRMRQVQLFGVIGLLVLLIACINFINLATARTEKRRKEVAVRKTIGARTRNLATQFLGESALVIVLAFGVAVVVVLALLPTFNALIDAEIQFPWSNLTFWGLAFGLVALCIILAGGYPAFFLTRFSAKEIMQRGTASGKAGQVWGRRVLVVTQFVVSIALIAGSLIVYQQVQFGQSLDSGYDKTRLVHVPLNSDLRENYAPLKKQLLTSGVAESISRTSTAVTEVSSTTSGIRWPGSSEEEQLDMAFIGIGEDYFSTLGLKLLNGRDFNPQPDTDGDAMIINEAAVERMGLTDPLATVLQWDGEPHPVVGVVEDIIMESPFDPVRPTIYLKRNWRGPMLVRLSADQPLNETLKSLESITAQYDPITPFSYTFVEESYAEKFKSTNFLGVVMLVFAGLAVLLSALGLLGLAMHLVERKSKEVSIRKVLGASIRQIWLLLSQEFLLLIVVGGLIAVPLGAYFLEQWLATFTYRIDLPWLMFGLAIGLALTIALITVSAQSLQAALINPAEKLRDE